MSASVLPGAENLAATWPYDIDLSHTRQGSRVTELGLPSLYGPASIIKDVFHLVSIAPDVPRARLELYRQSYRTIA